MSVWTTPTTRSTGLLVTAAIWNADIVNNLIYLKTAPVFDTAVIIGAATTAGVRLDLESGTLAVREGDDSAYAPLITSVVNLPSGGSINFATGDVTITHSTNTLTFAGAASGYIFNDGNITATRFMLVNHASNDAYVEFQKAGTRAAIFGNTAAFTGTNGAVVYAPAGLPVNIYAGGVERLTVTDSGNVGIGGTPGSVRLDLIGLVDAVRVSSSTTNSATKEGKFLTRHYTNSEEDFLWAYPYSTSTENGIAFGGGSSSQNAATVIGFYTATNNTTVGGTERMRIPAAGGVQCVTTLSVGNATPAASGAGVTFPAAQSASSDANTLDDYQEASWTPTIVGSTTAGTGTYASGRFGRYTKIGNMITLWANLNWTGHTGTGNIEIGGLPENVVSLTDYRSAGVAITNDIALTAGNLAAVRAADAGTTLQLIQQPTGGGLWSNVPMDTNGGLTLTITYMTN